MKPDNPSHRRFVALDRDGTIVRDAHYLADPAGLELLPGAATGLRMLLDAGFGLVVVTNQSGIGRGRFDLATLDRIHERFRALLAEENVAVDGIYYCPHVDADDCRCRKPRPGMLEQAALEHGFALSESFVIGDRAADVELAAAVGATGILVRTGYGAETERSGACRPAHIADDLQRAARYIVGRSNAPPT